jgi:hypothetical protein
MAQLLQAREMAQLSNQLVVTSLKPEREQVHKGDPDKVDLCMLLQDANNEAGSQGELRYKPFNSPCSFLEST